MSATEAVIQVRNLGKTFETHEAVKDVSFDLHHGRVYGLVGPNGAGKTTLIRMILGLAKPTTGSALLWGKRYVDVPDAGRRIGVVMDGMRSVPGATGRQELRVWAAALGVSRRRMEAIMDMVGLTYAADRDATGYSTGMRQRLSLAIALLGEPDILFLDEPTNGLDPEGIMWLRELLREFAAKGGTVLISSHILAEIERTVDEVIVFNKSVIFAGPVTELTATGDLESRFIDLTEGRVHVHV